MIEIKKIIGNIEYKFEASDFKTMCKISGLIGMIPNKCDDCKSEDVYLYHKSPSGNDYYGIKCKKCGAELNFHQKKEGGFYLQHDEKMEVWKGEKESKPSDSNNKSGGDLF